MLLRTSSIALQAASAPCFLCRNHGLHRVGSSHRRIFIWPDSRFVDGGATKSEVEREIVLSVRLDGAWNAGAVPQHTDSFREFVIAYPLSAAAHVTPRSDVEANMQAIAILVVGLAGYVAYAKMREGTDGLRSIGEATCVAALLDIMVSGVS